MTSVSHGTPCAGNPHARFEEGASAPESPRRNALLHRSTSVLVCAAASLLSCRIASGDVRGDFEKGPTSAARCALLGGMDEASTERGWDALARHGFAPCMTPVDAAAFECAASSKSGMKVFRFTERSGTHRRELRVKPGNGFPAGKAELWDPRQGTMERPFAGDDGVVRVRFRSGETLFLVWPDGVDAATAPLPIRLDEIVGREAQVRGSRLVEVREETDGGAALEGASWIWHPDAMKAKGVATLRTAFNLPEGTRVDRASLTFSIDNGGEVRLNGRVVGAQPAETYSWSRLSKIADVRSSLVEGRNVLEAKCDNIVPGDAGFIASLDITAGGKKYRVFTDGSSWEASLDGTSFKPAKSAGTYGSRPWLRFNAEGIATQKPFPKSVSAELSFNLGRSVPPGRLFFVCDGGEGATGGTRAGVSVSVNAVPAGECPAPPYTFDVTRFLRPGDNVVRVVSPALKNPRLVWTAPAQGVYDLRCEYLAEPLGVVKPRFFWKYAGEKPEKWKVRVWECSRDGARPAKGCAGRDGDCSIRCGDGMVAAFETSGHLFVEPQWLTNLVPFARYRWRVEGGGAAAEGTFVAGIEKWRKPFFKPPWQHGQEEYWIARKKMSLKGAKSVILALASLGSHRLYVNGKPAGDCFGPNRSHVEDGILLAETYDVTRLVKEGENEFTVYLHDGWARLGQCREKESCLSVDGRAVTADGVVAIDSVEPWEVSLSADSSYGPIGIHNNGRRRGIERLCDKERETRRARGVLRTGPAFSVSCDISDRDYAIREIKPVSITETAPPGKWKIDMGEAFSGFMRLKLKGEKGTAARMTVSDTFVDECVFGQISEFAFCGGDGIFENRMNTQSGRFFYLTGCEKPGLDDVTGIVIGCCGRITGAFRGDPDLQRIAELDRDTFIATTMGGVTVDCPHRERLGYGEASLSAMWGDGMPQFDSAAYYYAYLLKWASSQRPDGSIPHVSPNGYGWGGTFWSNFPVYALAEYCRRYPDARLKGIMRPVIDKWLDYLHSHVGADGILAQYEPKKGDCLGDWLYPEIHWTKHTSGDWGHTVEGMFFNNCSYAWAIKQALEIDGLVTDSARRAGLERRHAALVKAIDRKWYKSGLYVSEDARYQSIALLCGAAEAGGHRVETEEAIQDIVEWKGYVDGGSPSYTVILRALCMSVRGRELALRTFRRREAPGFLYFADEGYNTIPEDWWYGRASQGSMIHTCYTGPAGALFHGFAGIEIDGNKVTVNPLLSDTLPNFSAYTETLYGTLAVRVETKRGRRIVWVTCPDGCEGAFIGRDDKTHPLHPGLNRFETAAR
ncbi:MAG: alpha-L-rhamnosidase N-terminal domain-containing protein [Kiritimatiellae bacterium]|nr:alpha-L-rhamnosidase N-terminal domain-containing protein [Kiritimatiellia bacterium]